MLSHRLPSSLTRVLSFALLLSLALAGAAVGQARGEIEGVVSDAAGNALADVAVTVKSPTGETVAELTTNKKGKFELKVDAADAPYDVTFAKEGLATESMAVEVKSGMVSSLTISLRDQALQNQQLAVEAFNEGVGLLQSGNEQGALAKFTAAAELNPDLAEAHRLIAIIAANTDDLDTAAEALERFLEMAPDQAQAAAPAAYPVYRHQGAADKLPAVREHLRALGVARDFASNVYNEGVAAIRAENEEEARTHFEEAIALDPTLAAPYQSLAALHFNAQEFDQALPYLEKLAEVAPDNVEGQRMTFYSHLMKGQEPQAKEAGKRWLVSLPAAKDDLLKKAEEMFESNQAEEARVIGETLIAADSSFAPGHYLLGRVLAGAGKTAEAKQHLQHFLELAPDHPEAEAARQMLAGL